jgi:LAO/AO transport system kinase
MIHRLDSTSDYRDAIRAGDRRAVARAITRLESTRPDHIAEGQAILAALLPYAGNSLRIGITGSPGVGKSTFIERFGMDLIERGHRVAVLAVDPSSPVTGGSILGDKTRMAQLAVAPEAYIRPSPSRGSLGGVAHRTREAMLVCEAAGYDVVIVETVGIGQSEVTVAAMVDFFLVLLMPGGGDELQGIKRGVIELADVLVVNKADGDSLASAERTAADYASALQLIRPHSAWTPRALRSSALTGDGMAEVRDAIFEHRDRLRESGELEARRRDQARSWMWSLVEEQLHEKFRSHPEVAAALPGLEAAVAALEKTPAVAARALLDSFSKP